MAGAYLAEVVNPDLDIKSDKCTVDDIVMGTQSHGNTESKHANQRGNQGTNSCTYNTKSTSKRATERANHNTGGCAKGTENCKLCRGNNLKVLQLYFGTRAWHRHAATLLASRSWIVTGVWRHNNKDK